MRGKLREWRQMKAEEAQERHVAWEMLTPQQQLKELDRRLGKGIGAKKQRARLAKRSTEEKVDSSS
jgi:hypothetical protein